MHNLTHRKMFFNCYLIVNRFYWMNWIHFCHEIRVFRHILLKFCYSLIQAIRLSGCPEAKNMKILSFCKIELCLCTNVRNYQFGNWANRAIATAPPPKKINHVESYFLGNFMFNSNLKTIIWNSKNNNTKEGQITIQNNNVFFECFRCNSYSNSFNFHLNKWLFKELSLMF